MLVNSLENSDKKQEKRMEITVFGLGCVRCAETEKLAREIAAAKGGNITVRKVSDFKEMMAAGVMATPAVAVNGVVKSTGRVPAGEEIAAWIDAAAESSGGCRRG